MWLKRAIVSNHTWLLPPADAINRHVKRIGWRAGLPAVRVAFLGDLRSRTPSPWTSRAERKPCHSLRVSALAVMVVSAGVAARHPQQQTSSSVASIFASFDGSAELCHFQREIWNKYYNWSSSSSSSLRATWSFEDYRFINQWGPMGDVPGRITIPNVKVIGSH
jgi:hypothetical protein